MATLDIEKLRKVRGLMTGGATDGERAAARSRAESIARAAGLTLDAALSKLDGGGSAKAPPNWTDFFSDMMRERWERDAPARADMLKAYGSKEAIFAETEHERLLREALGDLWWDHGDEEAPQGAREAAMGAFPMPSDLAGAWVEWKAWSALWKRRRLFDHQYELPLGVSARWERLEVMLDHWSDPTFAGITTRTRWLHYWETEGGGRGWGTEKALAALLLDIAMMQSEEASTAETSPNTGGYTASASPKRRTNADKRADVLSMLDTHSELSDREIARRVGVSPQTVSTHRQRARKRQVG